MAKKLTVAVVGLGYFSQFHLNAWAGLDSVGKISVTDPVVDRLAWATQTYDVEGFDDAEALIAHTVPDIVDIIAPPPAHAGLIRSLAVKGRVLICQKPFCTSLEEATDIAAYADRVGATLVIHENFRFQPWHRTAKQFLESGQLGAVYQCRFALRPGDGQGPGAYASRQPAFRSMPRLLVHETGVHFIDLFRWMFGEIVDVYADIKKLNPAIAGEDAGLLILNHASGVQSLFDGNRLSDHRTDNPRRTMGEMTIEGENGVLTLGGDGHLAFREHGEMATKPVPLLAPVDDTSFGGGCVEALIKHVVHAVQTGGTFENTAADYLPVIHACESAYLSAAQGRKITL